MRRGCRDFERHRRGRHGQDLDFAVATGYSQQTEPAFQGLGFRI